MKLLGKAWPARAVATVALAAGMALAPVAAHAQTIGELDESIKELEGTISEREDAVREAQDNLAAILRDAYKNGDLGDNPELLMILEADSLDEIIAGNQYLESLNERYVSMIASAKETLDGLSDAREALEDLRAVKAARIKSREEADSIHFRQAGESYSSLRYYCGSIGSAGCGLCAYTVAIDILQGADYTPETMLPVCGDWAGLIHYTDSTVGTPDGTTHAQWTKNNFDVEMKRMESSVPALRKTLSDGESVVIALSRGHVFKTKRGVWRTSGGHYVCIYRCDDKGFYVQDSAYPGDDGRAVYYTDAEIAPMLSAGVLLSLSN